MTDGEYTGGMVVFEAVFCPRPEQVRLIESRLNKP